MIAYLAASEFRATGVEILRWRREGRWAARSPYFCSAARRFVSIRSANRADCA